MAIGNFDGVHLGHARIVARRDRAGPASWAGRRWSSRSIRTRCALLRPDEAPPPLTWTDRKAELLAALGVDAMIAYPTDEELLRPDAATSFSTRIVREQLDARAMVEGPNFYFGHDRTGTIDVLAPT